MGIRKDYFLREAALSLAQVKGLLLYDLVLVRKVMPYKWIKASVQITPGELDDAGIRVAVDDDTFDFIPDGGDDLATVRDVVDQWRVEAVGAIETKDVTVVKMAERCGLSRQTLYRLVNAKADGLPYLYTLRGRNPVLLWKGRQLASEYARVQRDLEVYGLMERLT